ncbi:PD40 domain-containing protein [Shewanella sp. 4t3-1-2LB]|uniref:S41 family peptidase n=1 Tax=Shewanella sp. 4t3-1-2LB TaxID=2817682 RepID=UPI001A991C2D|nr:S41 family peptidase [Shewanella sp. 4t3-1-2LB]MBO1270355.1 PD40 domain-containing protein [Shewanella sp. 4t3-1-2LB]
MKLRHSVACCMLALGTFAGSVLAAPAPDVGYYRTPDLHGNTLVFTAEGDIWTQQLGDSHASRLTSLPAEELDGKISPDGQTLAFTANYDGVQEVYTLPMHGGIAKRVTFENSRVKLQGWTPKGEVLYATDNAQGPSNFWVLRSVNPQTLTTHDIPLADAVQGAVDAKGEYVYFVRFGLQVTGDNAKVYRGGAAGTLWRYQLGKQQEAQRLLPDHQGSIRSPMVWNNRVYFVSDASGNANIWSMSSDGSDVKQLTDYKDFEVRSPALDQGRIVFQLGADIHMVDIASGNDKTLSIHLASDFPERREHWVNNPLKYIADFNLAPAGNKLVLTARSHVAVAGTDGSRLIQLATDGSYRLRNAVMSKDGKWIYAISDASGEQEIWRYAADGSDAAKQLTKDGNNMRMSLVLSPDGRYLANDDYQGNLWLLDLEKGGNSKIVSNNEGLAPYQDIVWSPDSRYLAITRSVLGSPRPQIMLYAVEDGKSALLTSDKYESFSPAFSRDGKWLYFLSNREFNSTPTSPWGDRNMGPVFDKRADIFALALDPHAEFPFRHPDELSSKETADSHSDKDPVQVKVDWQGLAQRLWQVPVPSGNYGSLQLNDNGLYLKQWSLDGRQQDVKFIKFDNLSPKLETFADDVKGYQLSEDGKKIFLFKGTGNGQMLIVDAGEKISKDLDHAKVLLDGWQLAINPQLEWRQMFDDAWLMHRESFFDKKMRGVDWQATKAKYQPLLARVTDRHELADIFTQMMGELDALHSQVRGGDFATDPQAPEPAALGARLTQTKDGVVISHIYRNDPELPQQASPLAQPGVDVTDGDIITHFNGRKIANLADITALLRNQADKQVLLQIQRGKQSHKIVVKPVSLNDDNQLRYLDWVYHNAAKVSDASQGKIGYLHLYAMGAEDINNFAREFYANYDKQGLIIDVRRNRGGNIDSWIIEKLLRKAWAFWQPTHGTPNANMQQTFRGHLVVLTDQLTYSDGETFSAGIKALGIAPLIGKRTAGAGVWLSGRNRLTDGGMARVAEYPQYAMDGRWIVEGRGVSPDIEVDNLPFATFQGQDAQLQKALVYLQDKLKSDPVPPLQGVMPARGEALPVRP